MRKVLATIALTFLAVSGIQAAAPMLNVSDQIPFPAESIKAERQMRATRAQGSMEFTWWDQPYTFTGFQSLGAGHEVFQAFQIDPDVLKKYPNSKISQIFLYGGSNAQETANPDTDVTVFLSHSLSGTPFYSQKATLNSKAGSFNVIDLDTPQSYDAEQDIYVGFHFTSSAQTSYCFVIDGVPTTNPSAFYTVAKSATDVLPAETEWYDGASQIGAICIGCTIEGDDFAEFSMTPQELSVYPAITTESNPVYTFAFLNEGANPITNFTVHVEATGENPYDITIPVNTQGEKFDINRVYVVDLDGEKFSTTGYKEISITIPKINDTDNPNANVAVKRTISVCDQLYDRKVVVETATGNWCQWCPSSIYTLEWVKENFGENGIGIAYHCNAQTVVDKMTTPTSSNWVTTFNTSGGVPFCIANRYDNVTFNYENQFPEVEKLLKYSQSLGALVEAEVTGMVPVENTNKATVSTKFRFAGDMPNNYKASVVIVEDGIGPFKQANAYSGSGKKLFGWEDEDEYVDHIYNDIERYSTDLDGKAVSEDENLEKGKEYTLDFEVNLKRVNTVTPRDEAVCRAIVLVTDNATGEIMNAGQMEFKYSDVRNIMSDSDVQIAVGDGSITVSNADNVAIYTTNGMKVADGSATGLATGIYIVRADNIVKKVLVK